MAAGARVKITLRCEECKQRNYNTVKNKKKFFVSQDCHPSTIAVVRERVGDIFILREKHFKFGNDSSADRTEILAGCTFFKQQGIILGDRVARPIERKRILLIVIKVVVNRVVNKHFGLAGR